jgi:hypothetical protein
MDAATGQSVKILGLHNLIPGKAGKARGVLIGLDQKDVGSDWHDRGIKGLVGSGTLKLPVRKV